MHLMTPCARASCANMQASMRSSMDKQEARIHRTNTHTNAVRSTLLRTLCVGSTRSVDENVGRPGPLAMLAGAEKARSRRLQETASRHDMRSTAKTCSTSREVAEFILHKHDGAVAWDTEEQLRRTPGIWPECRSGLCQRSQAAACRSTSHPGVGGRS